MQGLAYVFSIDGSYIDGDAVWETTGYLWPRTSPSRDKIRQNQVALEPWNISRERKLRDDLDESSVTYKTHPNHRGVGGC